MRGVMRQRAMLPERRDRAIDDVGLERLDAVIVKAQPRHHTGAKALDEHIGAGNQVAQRRLAFVALEVEHDAGFAAVEIGEPHRMLGPFTNLAIGVERGLLARRIARCRFHLDHFGALIGHHHRHHRPGQELRQVDHRDASQLAHVSVIPPLQMVPLRRSPAIFSAS